MKSKLSAVFIRLWTVAGESLPDSSRLFAKTWTIPETVRKIGAVTPRRKFHQFQGEEFKSISSGFTSEKKVCPAIIINIAKILAKSRDGNLLDETFIFILYFQHIQSAKLSKNFRIVSSN